MTVRKLKNATITHVSYVDKGANKKQFFLTKSVDNPTIEKDVKILINKEEDEQRLVYGVVYEPNVPDAHNDMMEAPDIEKAAHRFLKDYRNIDKQHDFQGGYGEVVESYVAPQDFEVGGETITKGSWVLVTKADEETWDSIKKGEITGYSMAGTAEVEEVAKSDEEDNNQMQKFFKALKDFFTKSEFLDAHNESSTNEYENEEEIDMKKEDLQAILKEALDPINEKLTELEKEFKEEVVTKEEDKEEDVKKQEQDEQVEAEAIAKQLKDILKEELAPINERLENVEKARGISKSLEDDAEGDEIEKEESVFKNLFTYRGQL